MRDYIRGVKPLLLATVCCVAVILNGVKGLMLLTQPRRKNHERTHA